MAARPEQQADQVPLDEIAVSAHSNWVDGPPHEIFKRLRHECPVHWSEIVDYDNEEGLWSLTRADDVRAVSLDWRTYSSERGGVTGLTHQIPLELVQAMFIGMDPPKHDRIKMLFQRGFTPKRIAEHEDEIREIAVRVLDGVAGQGSCDLVDGRRAAGGLPGDRQLHGNPRGRRRGLGDADEHDPGPRRPRPQPGGRRGHPREGHPGDLRALPGDDRRAPREPDRRPDQRPRPRRDRRPAARGARDRDGVLPARRRRQRQRPRPPTRAACER